MSYTPIAHVPLVPWPMEQEPRYTIPKHHKTRCPGHALTAMALTALTTWHLHQICPPWGLSLQRQRQEGQGQRQRQGSQRRVRPGALPGPGVRWLGGIGEVTGQAARLHSAQRQRVRHRPSSPPPQWNSRPARAPRCDGQDVPFSA